MKSKPLPRKGTHTYTQADREVDEHKYIGHRYRHMHEQTGK